MEIACTQALWQFSNTLAVTKIQGSSQQAKDNAAMTLVLINAVRITLLVLSSNSNGKLLSLEFCDNLAGIKNDDDMNKFVREVFTPLLTDKDDWIGSLPRYKDCIQPLVQLFGFLYSIKKDRHVEIIRKIHGLFVRTLEDEDFTEGIHKLVLSIIAALMTQPEHALRMYPVLSSLGKFLKKRFFILEI